MAFLAIARFVFAVVATLAAGGSLNLGILMLGADMSANQALTVAAGASCGVAIVRVLGWSAISAFLPLDLAVAPAWTLVATADASMILSASAPAVGKTLLGALDVFNVIGIAFAALGVRETNPEIGVLSAVAASALWTGAGTALFVAFSALTGIPVV